MQLKTIILLAVSFALSSTTLAQDTIPYSVYVEKRVENPVLQTDTIASIIDTVDTSNYKKDVPLTTLKTVIKDSLGLNLEDDPIAKRLDNAWRKELARMDLYDSILSMVNYANYNEEVFAALPTDTLKKRLAILDAKTPFNLSLIHI